MKPYEIKIEDIQRILFGEVPHHFLIEAIFRALFIFILLMMSMRLMGKRMASGLSRNEMAAIASLAAAIGVPLMNPDRGMLPPFIIAAVIIMFQWGISKRAVKHRKFESITQDKIAVLINDGVLDTKQLMKTRLSQARVFAQLRGEGIMQLGTVKKLYIEADGTFSLLKANDEKPGLSVIPPWDEELTRQQEKVSEMLVCNFCGFGDGSKGWVSCPNCKNKDWTIAVK
jgi:uncharacterized membrane protein YcaP (DUF421 family)